ncbi:MAG: hypothetical protein KAG70_08890, partial [Alcanivorax sp.]|nr:hypothetical protein [Alcanivorax sp.]
MTKALAFGQNYSSEGGHRPVRRPGTGGGVLVTVGVCSPGPMAVLTLKLWFFFGNTELSLELW